jgi:hypothetical protein
MTSTYDYLEPLNPEKHPYTIEGHRVKDGIHSYLFHFGVPITAIGGCENISLGWHCYHVIDGFNPRRDMAETLCYVNEATPRFME